MFFLRGQKPGNHWYDCVCGLFIIQIVYELIHVKYFLCFECFCYCDVDYGFCSEMIISKVFRISEKVWYLSLCILFILSCKEILISIFLYLSICILFFLSINTSCLYTIHKCFFSFLKSSRVLYFLISLTKFSIVHFRFLLTGKSISK